MLLETLITRLGCFTFRRSTWVPFNIYCRPDQERWLQEGDFLPDAHILRAFDSRYLSRSKFAVHGYMRCNADDPIASVEFRRSDSRPRLPRTSTSPARWPYLRQSNLSCFTGCSLSHADLLYATEARSPARQRMNVDANVDCARKRWCLDPGLNLECPATAGPSLFHCALF